MLDVTVPATLSPMPIKEFLRFHLGLSSTMWKKIKNTGSVVVNGKEATTRHLVCPNDTLSIHWFQPCNIFPVDIPLPIVYEDDALLIIDKPAGMLVHPTTSEHEATLGNGILYYFRTQGLAYAFHPVHRLDRNTSGLILIAKLPHIQHLLSANDSKTINKEYIALASGLLSPKTGTINAPISRHPASIIQRIVDSNGQNSVTYYQVLTSLKNATLVKLSLLTGRTHQIRVHLSHIGHPILGDDLYGGSKELIGRQALHAVRLSFTHPLSGRIIDVSSPLPADMMSVINMLSYDRKE